MHSIAGGHGSATSPARSSGIGGGSVRHARRTRTTSTGGVTDGGGFSDPPHAISQAARHRLPTANDLVIERIDLLPHGRELSLCARTVVSELARRLVQLRVGLRRGVVRALDRDLVAGSGLEQLLDAGPHAIVAEHQVRERADQRSQRNGQRDDGGDHGPSTALATAAAMSPKIPAVTDHTIAIFTPNFSSRFSTPARISAVLCMSSSSTPTRPTPPSIPTRPSRRRCAAAELSRTDASASAVRMCRP